MPRYKRTADEAQLDVPVEPSVPPEQQETLDTLRSMWEFASLMQYIFLFGHVVKIDDEFDIEDLEAECLKPSPSERLARIGLQLLKYVSSHRGLTPEIFAEYTRRQYLAKAPTRNPFGDEEDPTDFNDMDIYTRIKILQQLSVWTLGNAERIRGMMPQEEDHLNWRMDPLGWDKEDRAYYVLDDNRLYRRTDEPIPPPTPPKPKAKAKSKAKSKQSKASKSRATRASKRRKVEDTDDEGPEEPEAQDVEEAAIDDTLMTNGDRTEVEEEPGYGFTSKTWECIAITLEDYQEFMSSIFRSRDPEEKALRARIEEDVLPIIEKRAEAIRQKELKKLRELENMQKMNTAKRSSRLADKAEKENKDREEREAEEKRLADLRMAREEQERQKRIEEGHESRRLTREQRVRERESKRILHEEELARLEAEGDRAELQGVDSDAGDAKRASERQRRTQREQHQKELERLAEDEVNWYFDCSVCGKHGENLDDGSHSIACDRCNVWQHSKCHGFSPKQAESDDFVFICSTCKRKEEDAKKPKIPPLKLVNRTSASPEAQRSRPATSTEQQSNRVTDHATNGQPSAQHARPSPGPFGPHLNNGPSLSPHGQAQAPPGYRYPPIHNFAPQPPQQAWQGSPIPPPAYAGPPPQANGYTTQYHQQQHQYAHSNAVASAGGHPGPYHPYQNPPQPPQSNGYSQHAPPAAYHQPAHQQQRPQYAPQYPYQQYQQHQQPYQQPSQQQRPGSAHMTNGAQSPTKQAPKQSSSSPHQRPLQPYETPQAPVQQPSQHSPYPPVQHLQHAQPSPKTYLPPPAATQQHPKSPVKSSPAPQQQLPPGPSPRLGNSPHSLPPPAAMNGHQQNHASHQPNHFQTPQTQRPRSSGVSNHASAVVADGMSGPWPEGSKAIPLKHDQSPAPPASAHDIDAKRIFPPNTPLVPSPTQQPVGEGSIPIKKLPEAPVPEAMPPHERPVVQESGPQ